MMQTNPPPASDATPTPYPCFRCGRRLCKALEGEQRFALCDDCWAACSRRPTPGAGDAGGAGDVDQLEALVRSTQPGNALVRPAQILALIARLRAAEGVNAWGREHEAQLMRERNTYLAERDALRAAVEKIEDDWAKAVDAAERLGGRVQGLLEALQPFAMVGKGIPDNWPADVVVYYGYANPEQPRRGLCLQYHPAWTNDGGWRPTVADYKLATWTEMGVGQLTRNGERNGEEADGKEVAR